MQSSSPDVSIVTEQFLKKQLESFKSELKEQIIEAVKREVTEAVSAVFADTIQEFKMKVAEQDQEIEALKRYVVESERQKLMAARSDLASNFVIRGMTEEKETQQETEFKVKKLLKDTDLNLDIQQVERVGKRMKEYKTRTIKVVTGDVGQRNAVLEKSRALRDSSKLDRIYFDADKCYLDRKEAARIRYKMRQMKESHPNSKIRIWKRKLLVDDTS